MLEVTLYMKSGNVVKFNASEITKNKNLNGELTKLSWTNTTEKTRLFTVDLDSIEAITTLEIPEAKMEGEPDETVPKLSIQKATGHS